MYYTVISLKVLINIKSKIERKEKRSKHQGTFHYINNRRFICYFRVMCLKLKKKRIPTNELITMALTRKTLTVVSKGDVRIR